MPGSRSASSSLPRLVTLCFLADVGLAVAYLVDHLAGSPVDGLTRLLDLDGEDSIATWYSSMQLFLVAALMTPYALSATRRAGSRTRLVLALPAVFFAMSADEIVTMHETIGRKLDVLLPDGTRENTWFHVTGLWVIVLGVPFLLGFLWLIRSLRADLARTPGVFTRLGVGVLVFLAGAIGFETLSNLVEPGSWAGRVEVFAEELLEMAGVTVMLWAAVDLAAAAGLHPHAMRDAGLQPPGPRASDPPPGG